MAPADAGTEASRRMHEYLLAKQRKQEEYWLRKYGKVLSNAPPSVGKVPSSTRLPPLSSAGGSGAGSERGGSGGGIGTSGLTGDPSSGLLPPIAGAQAFSQTPPLPGMLPHHRHQPKGHAPIFHASEPVKDFFGRNAGQKQPRGAAGAAQGGNDFGNQVIPPSHRPPEPLRKGGRTGQLPPMGAEYSYGSAAAAGAAAGSGGGAGPGGVQEAWQQEYLQQQRQEQQQQQHQLQQQQSYGSPQQQNSYYSAHSARSAGVQHQQQQQQPGSAGGPPARLPPLQHEASGIRHPGPSSGGGGGGGVGTLGHGSRPLRNLELELTVIRAIKSREDVLERLRIAGGKLDSSFGGAVPVVLSPVDPLVRLFYRLVGTLRQRTLDVIEAIAAWRRKVSPSEPFIYYGVDYLAALGPDVAFLDELPFLRPRLTFGRAADDPFLAEVTPDGIPIEEATTCDLRRGGHRFSSDALRIRMARKVLAQYCGRPLAGNVSSYILDGGASAASATPAADKLLAELSQPHAGQYDADATAAAAMLQPVTTGRDKDWEEAEEEAEEDGRKYGEQQMMRAASPPEAAAQSDVPALPLRAITPPAAMEAAAMAAATKEPAPEEEEEEEEEAAAAASPRAETEASQAMDQPEEGEAQDEEGAMEEAAAAAAAAARDLEELPATEQPQPEEAEEELQQQQPEAGAEETAEAGAEEEAEAGAEEEAEAEAEAEDDAADFIDFALGAIIQSLEPQHVNTIQPYTFTVAGWEIDQQLEEVLSGIALPELATPGEAAAAEVDVGSAAAAPPPPGWYDDAASPSASVAAAAAAAEPPPATPTSARGDGGRIPLPPDAVKPPSRLGSAASRHGSRGSSRIPAPPSVGIPAPPFEGRLSSLSGEGLGAAADDATAAPSSRPPVRVHLRPNSREVNMGLSMDGEGPFIQTGTSAADPGPDLSLSSASTSRPPVRVHLRPNSREVNMGLSMDGEGPFIQSGSSAADPASSLASGSRPPVRVHLRPNSREVNMGLSMDGEGPVFPEATGNPYPASQQGRYLGDSDDVLMASAATAASAATRPPVRVHLRPSSREVNMGLSMDGESTFLPLPDGSSAGVSILEATNASGLPAISEDKSAYFGAEEAAAGLGGGGAGEEEEEMDASVAMSGDGLRPPVRVHLRPNSREVNMGLSMDGEGPEWGATGHAAGRYAAAESAAESAAEEEEDEAGDGDEEEEGREPDGRPPAPREPVTYVEDGAGPAEAEDEGVQADEPPSQGEGDEGEGADEAQQREQQGEEEEEEEEEGEPRPAEAEAPREPVTYVEDGAGPAEAEDEGVQAGDEAAEAEGEAGQAASRPPVRVHLRPNSREVNMDLSMDGEVPFPGAPGPVGLVGEEGRGGEYLPGISEDRSAYFPDRDPGDGHDEDLGEGEGGGEGEEEGQDENLGEGEGGGEGGDSRDPGAAGDDAGYGTPGADAGEAIGDGDGDGDGSSEYAADGAAEGEGEGGLLPEPEPAATPRQDDPDAALSRSMAEDGEAGPSTDPAAEAEAEAEAAALVPALDEMPLPLQGPLSARGNRASLRSARSSSSRPGSATPRESLA